MPSVSNGRSEANGAIAPWMLAITTASANSASIATAVPAETNAALLAIASPSARRNVCQSRTVSAPSTISSSAAIPPLIRWNRNQ